MKYMRTFIKLMYKKVNQENSSHRGDLCTIHKTWVENVGSYNPNGLSQKNIRIANRKTVARMRIDMVNIDELMCVVF